MEMLIAVGLISIVGVGMAAIYGTSQTYLTTTLNATDAQGDAAFALRHLTPRLQSALAVTAPPANTPASDLQFTYQDVVGGPQKTMRYVQSGSELRWYPDFGNALTTYTVLAFNLDTPPSGFVVTVTNVSVTIKIQSVKGGQTVTVASTVQPRGWQVNQIP